MKGKNKGFTLIELLAAIVILGILVGITLPALVGFFDDSRNKMYVSDARKLISLAEYRVRANSSEIEKPDEGDCILISMLYLDTTDFDNPPGEGRYDKEGSFVVVKNNGGKLEYAAQTVEKLKKGGYKGVELTSKATLASKTAVNHVVGYKSDSILNVETDINRGYLNEKLGEDYMSRDNNITAIYNYPELVDHSSSYGTSNDPKIVYASLMSTSSKYFNTLEATLQLKVDDKDTPRSSLNVYIAIGSGYEDATTPIPYGDNDTFSYTINFANYGKGYDGSGIKIYVIVKDPDGNETKKTITYQIHKNLAPEIDNSSEVTRRDRDVYHGIGLNMLSAKVKLAVSDDIDENSNLSVCFRESPTDEEFDSCDDYHDYYDYFSTENIMEYRFTNCEGGCKRDGSTHYLTAFVKDSLGAVSKKQFSYTFSINKVPKIQSYSIESKHERFTTTGSRVIFVNIEATDDVDRDDQMFVKICDGIGCGAPSYGNQPIVYTINGNYDGSTRTIEISVIDSEGAETESKVESYTLYKNKAPKINSYTIASSGAPCLNTALCPPEEGGSKTINVYLDAEDDIDYESLTVCLSLNPNKCTSFKSYTYFDNRARAWTMDHEYDGSSPIVYVFVKDSYGLLDTDESEPYKLYVNQDPVLDFAVFNSRTDGRPVSGSLNTIFNISARDDVDTASKLKFQIIEDGVVTLNNARLSDYMGKDNYIRLAGSHDGRQRNIEVKVIDTDGATDSKSMTYDVYEGRSPEINLFSVFSATPACLNEDYCPIENNGNYVASYYVQASDDIDNISDISICVSESNTTCDNYISYANFFDDNSNSIPLNYTFNVDSTTPYDGSVKTLYLYVKDSDGNVVKDSKTYKLYENKKPVITEDPTITVNGGDPSVHFPDITYKIDAEDDLDEVLQIKYCYKKDGGSEVCTAYETFNKTKVLDNENFFNTIRPSGETYVIYSKIKDSYGEVKKSSELTYKLYTDNNPSIYQSNIVSGSRIYKNNAGEVVTTLEGIEDPSTYSEYTRLKINFSVDDPFDKYSVCISSNNSSCGSYQGNYEGNDCSSSSCNAIRKTYTTFYDKAGFITDGDDVELYLFVKDSYGYISKVDLYNDKYTECEYYNEEDASYEYVFDSELTNTTYGHSNAITIDRCAGMCYYYNSANDTTHEVFAMYKQRITYTDKFNSSVTCNANNPEERDFDAACDYKDCFYKNDNYTRYAIGTRLYNDEEVWMTTINEDVYSCSGHYNLYISSYNEGDRDITLTKTNTKICNTAVVTGAYDYDSNSLDPYVRIDD